MMKRNSRILAPLAGAGLVAAALFAARQRMNDDSAKATQAPTVAATRTDERDRNPVRPSPAAVARWKPLVNDSLPLEERLNTARGIDASISAGETALLFDALDHQPRPGGESHWWVVMNEIMEQMRKHGAGAGEYSARLSVLVSDSNRHQVVRDYAIQHLAQWIAPVAPDISPGENDPARVAAALEAISRATRDPSLLHTSVPGTALMSLTDISSRLPQETITPVWNDLRPFLEGVITGTHEAPPSLRVSAIQAVAVRGEAAHLPVIRDLAASAASDPSVRLSSIAALGFYADPTDRPFFETLSTNSHRFRYAALSALERYETR